MITQWTAKGNRDVGSSCSRDRGLHRYLRNFGGGGGFEHPTPPLSTPLLTTTWRKDRIVWREQHWRQSWHWVLWCNTLQLFKINPIAPMNLALQSGVLQLIVESAVDTRYGATLFFHGNLGPCAEGGCQSKCSVTGNFCSLPLMVANWKWRHIGGWVCAFA